MRVYDCKENGGRFNNDDLECKQDNPPSTINVTITRKERPEADDIIM